MKFSHAVLTVITLVCFNFALNAGDKQEDKELFDKVSAKLDKGGSYLNYQSNKYLFRAIENSYLQIPEAIKIIVPDLQQQILPMMIYNCLQPITKSLGINEMLAAGASSILISEKTEKSPALFRSRQFLYHGDKKTEGIIWDFMAGENHELSGLDTLPKETLFAGNYEFAPSEIWNKVKIIFAKLPFPPIQAAPIMAEQNFLNKFKIKLPDFLDSISGNYSSLLVSAKDSDGKPALYGMFKIPNKNDIVFKVLSEIAKAQKDLQVLPDEISSTTPPVLSWLKPVVCKDDKNIYIVSNKKILEIIKNTSEKKDGLVTTAEFQSLSQGMSRKGIAFFYFNSNTIKVIINIIKANASAEDKDWTVLAKLIPPSDLFMVISKEKDGIISTMNSPMDIPLLITYSSVLPSVVQVAKLIPALGVARTKARRIGCTSNLKQIGLALKMYAMDHKDKYPTENNAAGLNKLIKEDYLTDLSIYVCPNSKTVKGVKDLKEPNSSYIYIGDFTEGDGPDIPVAFDKFGNKEEFINILFQDGHVSSMPCKAKNCRDLIEYLAKRSKFKPDILKKLREKAIQIDKELGYK
jgi:prepilin-type processing-associated H-X9-DG protein